MSDENTKHGIIGDNIVGLLKERRELKHLFDKADRGKERWKEINDQLKDWMGDKTVVVLPGWRLEVKTQTQKERTYTYTLPEKVLRTLYVKWDEEEDE
jgi:hypothetical protein